MYEEAIELIDKIKIKKKEISETTMQLELDTYVNADDIGQMCEIITKFNPHEADGFTFWYQILDKDQLAKLYLFMIRCKETDDLPAVIRLATELTLMLLKDMLALPCEVQREVDKVGYLDGVEKNLDFYPAMDEFEKAHDKTHEVILMLATAVEVDGWMHTIHRN